MLENGIEKYIWRTNLNSNIEIHKYETWRYREVKNFKDLNSNIEIHKYFLYIFPTTYEVYLNSNIEIHKSSQVPLIILL